jgi:hypothetical protein
MFEDHRTLMNAEMFEAASMNPCTTVIDLILSYLRSAEARSLVRFSCNKTAE